MRRIALVAVIASVLGLGCGCTNWQMKYETCNATLGEFGGIVRGGATV